MTVIAHLFDTAGPDEPEAGGRAGVVFVPCAICRGPVDLGSVTEANDAPVCDAHFVTEPPPPGD